VRDGMGWGMNGCHGGHEDGYGSNLEERKAWGGEQQDS